MSDRTVITSESVTEGHPDKICDQVSDAVLDSLLEQDPDSRVAVECMTTTGMVIVAGEVTTGGYADVQRIARGTLQQIGYTNPEFGIDHEDAGVLVAIHQQSTDMVKSEPTFPFNIFLATTRPFWVVTENIISCRGFFSFNASTNGTAEKTSPTERAWIQIHPSPVKSVGKFNASRDIRRAFFANQAIGNRKMRINVQIVW